MGNDFLLYNKWMLKYTGNVCVETEYSIKDEHSEDQYTTTYRDGRIVKQQGAERNSWQYMWGYSNSKVAWKAVVEWNKNMMEKDKRYLYYNQKGLLSSSKISTLRGAETDSYVYTYDNYGNWITRKRSDGFDIVEREYVYY